MCKQVVCSYALLPLSSAPPPPLIPPAPPCSLPPRWVLEWPGQIVLVVTAVYWTREVAAAMASTEKGRLQACADSNTAQLTNIISLVGGREGGRERRGREHCFLDPCP